MKKCVLCEGTGEMESHAFELTSKDGSVFKGFLEDTALAEMIIESAVFVMPEQDGSIGIYVNCNDVFGPAADCEPLPFDEIENCYKNPIKWVALRRNKRPWIKREEWMKKVGTWDEDYERLPKK